MDNVVIRISKHTYQTQNNVLFAPGVYGEMSCPVLSKDNVEKEISKITGSFFVVFDSDDYVAIATDRMGSMPMFYSYADEKLYISDDIKWIKKEIGTSVDMGRVNEYRNCSFVLGDSTLLKGVHRVPAGNIVYLNKDGGSRYTSYFSYSSTVSPKYAYAYDKFKNDIRIIAERFAVNCANRKVVIPLSTGADSLLISSIVKMAGIKDVLCFTYGKIDAKEKKGSKYIADSMGFEWRFVEYTSDKWKFYREKGILEKYMDFVGNYSNCIHIQDLPAVEDILKDIPLADRKNFIFVPGHTGVIGGGNVRSDIFNADTYDTNMRVKIYGTKDFNLWGKGKSSIKKSNYMMKQFTRPATTKEEEISFYQKFDMQERQTKAIVCSVGVYEFEGASWALPLNDVILMEHLYGMAISDRMNKSKYKEFCKRLFEEMSGKKALPVRRKNTGTLYHVVRTLSLPLYVRLERIRRVWSHDLNWFELLKPTEKIKYILCNGQHITAITSDLYISSILNKGKSDEEKDSK